MLLNELFNSKIDLDVTHNDEDAFVTRADVKGNEYEFTATKITSPTGYRWDVEFSIVEADDEGMEHRSYGLTNKNDEFKVMSFVFQSMEQLIAAQDPKTIIFSASKQKKKTFGDGTPKEKFRTRADAYETIFKRIKGYKLRRIEGVQSDKFTLTKE